MMGSGLVAQAVPTARTARALPVLPRAGSTSRPRRRGSQAAPAAPDAGMGARPHRQVRPGPSPAGDRSVCVHLRSTPPSGASRAQGAPRALRLKARCLSTTPLAARGPATNPDKAPIRRGQLDRTDRRLHRFACNVFSVHARDPRAWAPSLHQSTSSGMMKGRRTARLTIMSTAWFRTGPSIQPPSDPSTYSSPSRIKERA